MVDTEITSDSYQFMIIVCVIISVILLSISIYRYATYVCEKPKILYKFVPRTFQQEQTEPVKASIFFKNMFEDASVNEYGIPLALNSQRKLDAQILASQ